MPDRPSKPCLACGRPMTWRKKWANHWDDVKFCSDACRRHKSDPTAAALEDAILQLLSERAGDKTICPSEAARAVAPDDWRPLMEPARRAARRLALRGKLVFTQAGRVIDPGTARGPVRLRKT